jgi:CheY-like chemotaxis protein
MAASSARVLVVEDDEAELGLVLRALRGGGAAVEVARDGVAALDRLQSPAAAALPRFTFVLLDLQLPRLGGVEVARRLKIDQSTRHIPVVVFSSSREAIDLQHCYEAGVNSYVVKPIDFAQLLVIIDRLAHYWSHLNERVAVAS